MDLKHDIIFYSQFVATKICLNFPVTHTILQKIKFLAKEEKHLSYC